MDICICLLILAVISIFSVWYYTRDTNIVRVKKDTVMDFKSAMDLTGVPVITFYQGDNKYNFIIDTGSNVSYINKGSGITYNALDKQESFLGASGETMSCQIGQVDVSCNNKNYCLCVRVADLSAALNEFKNAYGVVIHGFIGNDVMTNYKYCVDFKEQCVYLRK